MGQRRRFGQQIVHGAVDLLLIADPLAGAAERGGNFVDAPRQDLGIGRERGLFPDQFDLFLDARDLGIDEGELLVGLGMLADALTKDIDLPLEAAAQIGRRAFVLRLFLETFDAAVRALRRTSL